jgi:hypothetical protein
VTATITTALGVVLMVATGYWLITSPYRLGVVAQPLSTAPILPAPVVEIQNRFGQRVVRAGDTVRVTIDGKGVGRLEGVTAVPLMDGRAVFSNLRITLPETEKAEGLLYRLRFDVPGVAPAYSDPVSSEEIGPTGWSHLKLVRGRVNGQQIGAEHRTVMVRPGERVAGRVMLDYTTRWGSAAVMLGLTPSWGDRRKDFREISALPTPMKDGLMEVPIDLTAPDEPGDYAILLAFAAEARVDWIFSGTNWQVGNPVWGDGNDLQDWSAVQWDSADRVGVVANRVLHREHHFRDMYVPATTIRIRVVR